MAIGDSPIEEALMNFQSLVRSEQIENAKEAARAREKRVDVTGVWLGFSAKGLGLVEYDGKIYECVVLGSVCKQKYAKVNLRRTDTKNFASWN